MSSFESLIRAVPDFPKPGILFRDIMPLLADGPAFARCVDAMLEPWLDSGVQAVCGVESRGFIFAAAMAQKLKAGFVPLRKPGKLPPPVKHADYQLEYGTDRLEAGVGILRQGERVLLVDDVLATGGTLGAARNLLGQLGVEIVGASVVIELLALQGRKLWPDNIPLHTVLHY
ncbi:MAG TPA: adenine phosphoribosyltransferase [Dyella sp.]|nr:adenine phosphoribosyltransferase [Dyella sp.]